MKKVLFIITVLVSKLSMSQCYSAGDNLPNSGYLLSSSGVEELDSIVFGEIQKLENFYGVNVDFFYILETFDKNAMYVPQCNYNCNGSVLLGIKMLLSQLEKEHGIECIKAILAHEFGHCIQNMMNWVEFGKRRELHSDFMAGYYSGVNYNYTQEQLKTLFYEFYSMGDYNYWSYGHHGTNAERECAFLEGYYFSKENNVDVITANNYAVQYVVADNPCGVRKYIAKVAQLKEDVNSNNVGKLKVVALDGKKYKILTNNQLGSAVNLFINYKSVHYNLNGVWVTEKIPVNNTVELSPISATKIHPVYIYQFSWLWGDRLVYSYNAEIEAGKTTTIEINGNELIFYTE